MNDLLDQLLALTGQLEAAAGVPPETLAELRSLLAAILIQQNPGLSPVTPRADVDQPLNDAAVAGDALAPQLTAAGRRPRFVREAYLAEPGPELSGERFGPFIDGDAALVQFRIIEAGSFLSVVTKAVVVLLNVFDVPMLLPRGSTADASQRRFTLAPGTVWLQAARLVPQATGYVLLRVSGGLLELAAPAVPGPPGQDIQLPLGVAWALTLVPEAAPPAGAGFDGGAVALELPTQLRVASDGTVTVEGAIGVAGFLAGARRFDTPSGGPQLTDAAIVFPFETQAAPWAVAGNRSPLAQLNGQGTVPLALWALPVTQTPPAEAFEAAHGGSVALLLQGELSSTLEGAEGRFAWQGASFSANALGLELRARRANAAVRLGLALWGPARTELVFGDGVTGLRLGSQRGLGDVYAVGNGRLGNRWDLPRAASGQPFTFDGTASQLSTWAEPEGTRRVACSAQQTAEIQVLGLALHNLYLQVLPARQLGFAGSGATVGDISAGYARLLFDVQHGEPMLPDPYAASWNLPDELRLSEKSLSLAIRWAPGTAPSVQAQLEQAIHFPEPRVAAAESDPRLGELFREHLQAQPEFISLLDLSTRDHHLGLALESLSDSRPRIDGDNRMLLALGDVRLLMQPQVHWEPVQAVPAPAVGGDLLRSTSHGGRTLVGANSVALVPAVPGMVGAEIAAVANGRRATAALFSLPFGLRAFVRQKMSKPVPAVPPVAISLHQPVFDEGFQAAQQLRLVATGGRPPGEPPSPDRGMPGAMHQTRHLTDGNSVLPADVMGMLAFDSFVPLHAADLSGYGLSTFNHWHRSLAAQEDAFGVTQVRLDVLSGRTAFEVIEVRTVLAPCQSRVVRTIVLERRNSGRVKRFDSGWKAIDSGTFDRYVTFETGVLRALHNIRNVTELNQPPLKLADGSVWEAVRFDADAEVDNLVAGGGNGRVPALGHAGYIQIAPVWRGNAAPPPNQRDAPDAKRFAQLFTAVGGPIGGPVDCRVRVGGTLDMHLSALLADLAPDDAQAPGFAVAAYGSPTLPRAGQWSAVRIDGRTSDVSTVDPRRGIPVIRRPGQPCTFRDPADARRTVAAAEYGLLQTTPASRVLFPRPSVDPAQPGRLTSAPPLMADPVALLQASSAFPRAAFALRGQVAPLFDVSAANDWRLGNPDFSFDAPLAAVASGAGWGLQRDFGALRQFKLDIDSALPATPWAMTQPPDFLKLQIDPFPDPLFIIQSNFQSLAGGLPGLQTPTLLFGPALDALRDIVNALRAMVDLPFDIDVDVSAGTGPSPSFVVRLNMKIRLGEGPNERIDIGVGKFYGELEISGELEAALSGDTRGRLRLQFQGDVQQGILPPLLYAGGMFLFALEVRDGGPPLVEMGLGTTVSIGGDLVKGLVEVEATVTYGYTLIPETLEPGVMLGLEARAKLLLGLFGLSFSAQALARIHRLNDDATVTIFADVRVAGSIQVAVFFEEDVDFRTQFEQNIPLAALELAAGVNPLVAAASTAAALV